MMPPSVVGSERARTRGASGVKSARFQTETLPAYPVGCRGAKLVPVSRHRQQRSVAPFLGRKSVRFIFMDEAGTSGAPHEKLGVIVAINVHADEQLARAEQLVLELVQGVPERMRDGFVFHATQIWSEDEMRDGWSLSDRLGLLRRMMALPRRLGLAVTFSVVRSDAPLFSENLTPIQQRHLQGFIMCTSRADKFVRDHCAPMEIATIIAEAAGPMTKILRNVPKGLRKGTIYPGPGLPRIEEQALGYIKQEAGERVTRIRDTIHFVGKEEEMCVWIADACAFGLRRYFEGQSFGVEFCQAIFGRQLALEDFRGPASVVTYSWLTPEAGPIFSF